MGTSSPLNLNKIHTSVQEEWLKACSYNHALEQPLPFSSPELKVQVIFYHSASSDRNFFHISNLGPDTGRGKYMSKEGLFFKTLLLQIGKLQQQIEA